MAKAPKAPLSVYNPRSLISWDLDLIVQYFFFEEAKMNYITATKGPPSTRCTRVETPKSEQYLQA